MLGRWTDKLTGLLRTAKFYLQARLVRLDLGCVRLAKDPSSSLLEPLAALTALSDLRMSVYSNEDATLMLQLSELSALSNLQVCSIAVHRWLLLATLGAVTAGFLGMESYRAIQTACGRCRGNFILNCSECCDDMDSWHVYRASAVRAFVCRSCISPNSMHTSLSSDGWLRAP